MDLLRQIYPRKAGENLLGALVVGLATSGMLAFRAAYVEPERWAAVCALAATPFACLPREGLLWLQSRYLWGAGALALGLVAFFGWYWRVGVAAVVVGVAAVINYNATWGMLGVALGAWVWIMGEERH